MNAVDPLEHEVLARTLEEVRRARRRRTACKLSVLPLLLLFAAGWHVVSRGPSAAMIDPVVTATSQKAESAGESLTVVEWKGGTPSLVEYSGEELGRLNLTFSLEPVVAFPDEFW